MANCVQNIFNDFPNKGNRPLFLAICVVQNRHAGNMRRAGRRQTKACKSLYGVFLYLSCPSASLALRLTPCVVKNDKLSVIVLFSASAATAELNRTCTLKIKELIILHQFGIMPELSAVRRSSFPLFLEAGQKDKTKNECLIKKRTPDDRDSELSA